MLEGRRYRAFISYSQVDRRQARKLQRWLEAYRAPKSQGGGKIGSIFRDETHLAGAADLGAALKANIAACDALIVLCSPAAAKSFWVEREIRHFRTTGRSSEIFAVILDGEPNSADATRECFPPSFRRNISDIGPDALPVQPLAVNMAVDGRARACTRLAAGLLSISFAALWQHQRRRQRMMASLLVSAAMVFLCVAAAAIRFAFIANEQRQQAVEARDRALERSLAVSALNNSSGEPDRLTAERSASYALIAQSYRSSPQAWTAASRMLDLLPHAVISRDAEIVAAEFSQDGRNLLLISKDRLITLHDPSGAEKGSWTASGQPTAAAWSPSSGRFAVASETGQINVLDARAATGITPTAKLI